METYRIWSGTRTFLPGDDSEYTITTIVAEEIGMLEDVIDGKTYYVYQTVEGEVIVHLSIWSGVIGEPHCGSIFRFRSIEEAAQNDELRQALKDMRLI
jgi:hypothetical protein